MPDGLTAEERACFVRDGFVVLRGVVPPQECTRLLWDAVAPALARVGIDPFAPDTWDGGAGDTVRAPTGGDHPIPLTSVDSRWPALFESPRLRGALDALHGGTGRWQWAQGAADGLGWIHLRYPTCAETTWRAQATAGTLTATAEGSTRRRRAWCCRS